MTRTDTPLRPTCPPPAPWWWGLSLPGAALGLALFLGGCAHHEAPPLDLSAPKAADVPISKAGRGIHGDRVRALAAPAFEDRASAARDLVTAGDAAVPALGRAGDLFVPVAGGLRVSATRSVLQSILARSPPALLEQHLGSPWPNVRRTAAEEVGRRDRWSAIPRLIERLDDQNADVRSAAAASLRRLTNTFLGYRAEASLRRRRGGADRWRTWWSQEGRARWKARERGGRAASLATQ